MNIYSFDRELFIVFQSPPMNMNLIRSKNRLKQRSPHKEGPLCRLRCYHKRE